VTEFSLVFFPLVALIFAAFDFGFAVFAKATLHNAVREGVRFAITGRLLAGETYHDESIKKVVKRNALALLNRADDYNRIQVDYYLADGSGGTNNNSPGNIVVVSVRDYMVMPVAAVLWPGKPFKITVSATDKVEPFPGTPPPRKAGA
jgi:Flp pilus assembly protein TadG